METCPVLHLVHLPLDRTRRLELLAVDQDLRPPAFKMGTRRSHTHSPCFRE